MVESRHDVLFMRLGVAEEQIGITVGIDVAVTDPLQNPRRRNVNIVPRVSESPSVELRHAAGKPDLLPGAEAGEEQKRRRKGNLNFFRKFIFHR